MIDLVCLVPDKSIEAAIREVLHRPRSLQIRKLDFEIAVHPQRDSGCFHRPGELLRGYADRARRALVVLDGDWPGAPKDPQTELQRSLQRMGEQIGLPRWAHAVVIQPELEAWVFSDSPHVARELGWRGSMADLRSALSVAGLWDAGLTKPRDPKRAMDWALWRSRIPRSSSLYRELASKVSLTGCHDPAFRRLVGLLRGWFGVAGAAS